MEADAIAALLAPAIQNVPFRMIFSILASLGPINCVRRTAPT
jgi:hypothetical protein